MLKALIVDDNPLFRQSLAQWLRARFPRLQILEAADGYAVLDAVENLRPDLIFMDIKLPGPNGLALTREIKKNHDSLPIVIVTGFHLPEYREAASLSGADYFFSKDELSAETLTSLVASILRL